DPWPRWWHTKCRSDDAIARRARMSRSPFARRGDGWFIETNRARRRLEDERGPREFGSSQAWRGRAPQLSRKENEDEVRHHRRHRWHRIHLCDDHVGRTG